MMEDDIIELHRALQDARGLDSNSSRSETYRIHTAKVQQDIRDLSEEFNAARTAQLLNVPIEMVEAERAKMGEYNQRRRKFLATGDLDLHNHMVLLQYTQYSSDESKRTRQGFIPS